MRFHYSTIIFSAHDLLDQRNRQLLLPFPQEHGHSLPPLTGPGESVLVLAADGRLHSLSAAALRAGRSLSWPWSWLALLGMAVPSRLANAVYSFVGRNRYAWFGKRDACRMPTADERRRFVTRTPK